MFVNQTHSHGIRDHGWHHFNHILDHSSLPLTSLVQPSFPVLPSSWFFNDSTTRSLVLVLPGTFAGVMIAIIVLTIVILVITLTDAQVMPRLDLAVNICLLIFSSLCEGK